MKFFHVCLVVLLAFRMSEAAAQNMDTDSERARKVWTEHFRDDENLRNDLLDEFTATDGADWEGIDKLTRCYSVSEDRLRSAAMSLFEEATNLSSDGASHKDGVPLRLLANNALFCSENTQTTPRSRFANLAADKSRDGVLHRCSLILPTRRRRGRGEGRASPVSGGDHPASTRFPCIPMPQKFMIIRRQRMGPSAAPSLPR